MALFLSENLHDDFLYGDGEPYSSTIYTNLLECQQELMEFQESVMIDEFHLLESYRGVYLSEASEEGFISKLITKIKELVKTVLSKIGAFFAKIFQFLTDLSNKLRGIKVPNETNGFVKSVTDVYKRLMDAIYSDPSDPNYKNKILALEKELKATAAKSKQGITGLLGKAKNYALAHPVQAIAAAALVGTMGRKALNWFKGKSSEAESGLNADNSKVKKAKSSDEKKKVTMEAKAKAAKAFLSAFGCQKSAMAAGVVGSVCSVVNKFTGLFKRKPKDKEDKE